jgi:RNA polymerase sigma-70 factor (ECF subfamily)
MTVPSPASGDPRDELVQHLASLRAFALSLTRSSAAADDLVQDTILKAWSKIDQYTTGTNLRAWLFTILRNTYYSDIRKRRREVSDSDGHHAARLSQKPDHDGRMALADFAKAFATLPVEQREVLVLVGSNGFSYEEAAETCGCAVGTIKSRANRGRKRLAELLGLVEGEALELTDAHTMAVVTSQTH